MDKADIDKIINTVERYRNILKHTLDLTRDNIDEAMDRIVEDIEYYTGYND